MALDPHYNDFLGIDSRTNKMKQNQKAARSGSKNFVYKTTTPNDDFDVISKRRGGQRKTSSEYAAEIGLIEYKRRDVNTGQAKVEILGVARDGKLRKKKSHRLKIVRSGGTVTNYSLFYDESVSLWRIQFLNSSYSVVGQTTFDEAEDLDGLATTLTGLSITGLTFSVVDEDGASVTSSELAYLMDVVYRKEILDGDTVYNDVFYWELVPNPTSDDVLFDYTASGKWQNNSEFEGISYVNLNNSVYITDGGFPIKYDGFAAYRAGMPRTPIAKDDSTNYNGCAISTAITSGGIPIWDAGAHHFRIRLRYRDPNGFEVLGKVQDAEQSYYRTTNGYGSNKITFPVGQECMTFAPSEIKNDDKFPVYSCKINNASGETLTGSGPFTITVDSGHNIRSGMCLRLPKTNIVGSTSQTIFGSEYPSSSTYYFYALVDSVTSTSITISSSIPSGSVVLDDNTLIQGCFVPDFMVGNSQGSPSSQYTYEDTNLYGVSYVLYATKTDVDQTGTFYEVCHIPVPHDASHASGTFFYVGTVLGDSDIVMPLDDSEGEDLPRACRYLSKWQGQLVQSGRPYDAENLSNDFYPTSYFAPNANGQLGTRTQADVNFDEYTEVHLCDFQSFYWADPLNPEGFPQSGLNEEDVQTAFSDQIKGMSENKDSFFVFKDRSMAYFSGTLATGEINKELLESDIGCAAHNSIQEVNGSLVWLDSTYGFCSVVAGRLPNVIGWPVQDHQKRNRFKNSSEAFRFSGAKACNHRIEDLYICYVPCGTNDADNTQSVPYPSENSKVFVFDYSNTVGGLRQCWYVWDGINAAGGILSSDDDLIWSSLLDPASNNQIFWKQKVSGSIYDYSDHISSIDMKYITSWLNYEKYSVDKRFIRLAINSVLGGFGLTIKQYTNYRDISQGDYTITFPASGSDRINSKITMSLNSPKVLALSLEIGNNSIYEDVSINGFDIQLEKEFDDEVIK